LELRRLRSKWRSNTWTKIKVSCLHSLTIAWGYCLAVVSVVMQGVDVLAEALGDPNLRDQVSAAVGDTKIVGRILLGVSIITIVARLRTARKVN
jgi:hypothetical protein